MTRFDIPDPMPPPDLPPGYRLSDLSQDGDMKKVHRLLFRGFDNGDEPPEGGLADRRMMQSAPNFEPAHNIVIVGPDGEYASYGGIWFEPVNRIAYVEPVATDPDYRRRGLGRAAVMEGIRRCAQLGASVAYVGSNQLFYLAMGFTEHYQTTVWSKEWSE
jgi:predicted N-acetyltransferase YhbS